MLPVRQRSHRARYKGLLQPSLISLVSTATTTSRDAAVVCSSVSLLCVWLPSAGVWVKDTDASDAESYNRALDIMKLGVTLPGYSTLCVPSLLEVVRCSHWTLAVAGRLQKITAARLIEGLDIRQSPYSLTVQFLTVVPFFKVRRSAQGAEVAPCPDKRFAPLATLE